MARSLNKVKVEWDAAITKNNPFVYQNIKNYKKEFECQLYIYIFFFFLFFIILRV